MNPHFAMISRIVLAGLLYAGRLQANQGMVVEWGMLMNAPQNMTDLTKIALGQNHALALTASGVVFGWGSDSSGELNIPFDVSGPTAIAAGESRSYALNGDGTVAMWPGFIVHIGWTDVTAISARGYQIVARKSDGTVVVKDGVQPPAGLAGVTAVAAGLEHAVALKSNGTVVAWGSNFNG